MLLAVALKNAVTVGTTTAVPMVASTTAFPVEPVTDPPNIEPVHDGAWYVYFFF